MKRFSAFVVVLTVAAALCAAAPPGGPGGGSGGQKTLPGGKVRIQPPPAGVAVIRGVVVKSEVEGGTHWLTMVLTSGSGGTSEGYALLKNLGTLVPFRVTCRPDQTGLEPGHGVTVQCHLSGTSQGQEFEEGEVAVGIAVVQDYGEKVTVGDEPDYAAMEHILKDSVSDEARGLIVDVLIGLPGKRSSKALSQAIYDISPEVRLKAAGELVARQYEPAIKVLEVLLLHDIEDQLPFQIALAEIMGEAGYKSGLQFLLRHLNDEALGTVLAVVVALGKTGGADEAVMLEQLAKKTQDTDIAEAARRAVLQIHDRLGE
jgi:hypothetical protein